MVAYTDNFNRADETPLAGDYEGLNGVLNLVGNDVNAGTLSVVNSSRVKESVRNFDDDQYAQVTLTSVGSFDEAGPHVRMQSDGDGYAGVVENQNVRYKIVRIDANAFTTLQNSTGVTPAANDDVYLEISGSSLDLQINGTSRATTTDSTYTGGNPGFSYLYNNDGVSTIIDDFEADDLGGGVNDNNLQGINRGLLRGVQRGIT
jgi:hypothetical protein